ncbi:RNA polymerase II C-terminal domain kinase beta subunit [Saxophila tyrrhenica]|uniref:RNA polymerase II C-terminal domain kinase beta subunit n=1 Tax=Saxophila tyrrhenica TaxID=1690608 RepID=A0AAV9PND0_9PEZI|nr:RNA polymerase II C-terminal domain kinase beta subunit [Saxophila tyrrhenica]
MVFVPWADHGICKWSMLGRCRAAEGHCQWRHPEKEERSALWDQHKAQQKEDWEVRGIPPPVNPRTDGRAVMVEDITRGAGVVKSAPPPPPPTRVATPPFPPPLLPFALPHPPPPPHPPAAAPSPAEEQSAVPSLDPRLRRQDLGDPSQTSLSAPAFTITDAPAPAQHRMTGSKKSFEPKKGANKEALGKANANNEPLGRPNRLANRSESNASTEETAKQQHQPQAFSKNESNGKAAIDDLTSMIRDSPSENATTIWKRPDTPQKMDISDVNSIPVRKGDYWERKKKHDAEIEARKKEMRESEVMPPPDSSLLGARQSSAQQEQPTSVHPTSSTNKYAGPHQKDAMGAVKRMSNGEAKPVGPHPSTIRVSARYLSHAAVEKRLQPPAQNGELDLQERSVAEAREDSMRLQGVTWLDTVRRALQLPIRTYSTACMYYHKFRLAHPGVLNGMEYGNAWADACAASLLTACKVEDTLKKSKDILAAAYNLKASTHDQLGSDDAVFEAPSRAVIGLERMVLEAGGFDFRSKNPHKLFQKITQTMPEGEDGERNKVEKVGWTVMTDLFRTFAPLKQTDATMALAGLELAANLVATSTPDNTSAIRDALRDYDITKWSTTRPEIMETLLDLLDLYTQHTANTILGTHYSLDDFLRIRLSFNRECNEHNIPRHTTAPTTDRGTNGSTLQVANGHPTPVSPPQPGSQIQPTQPNQPPIPEGGGTLRFMLNPQLAADEKTEVQKFFVEEWEEYEEEIEVPIPRSESRNRGDSHGHRSDRSGGNSRRGSGDVRLERPPPPPRALNERDREGERERLREREREVERDRARMRDRERRFEGPGRRGGRYEGGRDRRFDEGRRRP